MRIVQFWVRSVEERNPTKIEEIYNNNNFYNPKLKENALKEELSKKKNDWYYYCK